MTGESENKHDAKGPESEVDGVQDNEDNSGAQESGDSVDNVQDQIDSAVSAALDEQKETVLRAQAEVQNMRRRCEKDVERAHKYGLEKFSLELLQVADNLERALGAVPAERENEAVKSISEGVELTLKGFVESLAKFGIQQVDPEGEPFDPQVHEAMSMLPNPEVEPNTVIAVPQKGYTLNGRVLRPAMVIVAKGA